MRQQLYEDSATDYLLLRIFDHNRQKVPSSATATIIIGGTTDVTAASATISVAGDVTYIPGATVLDELSEDCVVEWAVSVDGVSQTYRQLFDIVRCKLFAVVTDEDLIGECPPLQDERWLARGTADSGTSKTLVDADLINYQDDHFSGGIIEITDGTSAGQARVISDFAQSSGTVTWTTSCPSSIDTTSKYVVRRTYQRELDRAWDEVEGFVQKAGYRPALVMDSEELKNLHIYLALGRICKGMAKTDDVWWGRGRDYEGKALREMNGMQFVYDSDEDGVPDDKHSVQPRFRR
jgi:hypothetical protein